MKNMKKVSVIIILILINGILFAQSEKYVQAMTKALSQLDTTKSTEGLQKLSNTFERIALNEKSEWLPSYYQAYCNMIIATAKMQAQDMNACAAHLDKAQTALDVALNIAPKESEIITLQGYIYQGRIWENPMVKGAEYSPKVAQTLQTAIAINADNPRPYYLMGQQLLYTPEFYGGGAKAALPWLEKAAAKFENYQVPSTLHPTWGKAVNHYMLENAQKAADNK